MHNVIPLCSSDSTLLPLYRACATCIRYLQAPTMCRSTWGIHCPISEHEESIITLVHMLLTHSVWKNTSPFPQRMQLARFRGKRLRSELILLVANIHCSAFTNRGNDSHVVFHSTPWQVVCAYSVNMSRTESIMSSMKTNTMFRVIGGCQFCKVIGWPKFWATKW